MANARTGVRAGPRAKQDCEAMRSQRIEGRIARNPEGDPESRLWVAVVERAHGCANSSTRRRTATGATSALGSDAATPLGGSAAKIRWSPGGTLSVKRDSSAKLRQDVATERRTLRPRSGRRVGLARLTRRGRANAGMHEQRGPSKNTRQTKKAAEPLARGGLAALISMLALGQSLRYYADIRAFWRFGHGAIDRAGFAS